MGIIKPKCAHCRKQLGNYAYATECPHCRKELKHNRKPTALAETCPPSVKMFVSLLAGFGIGCGALLVAGLGEASGVTRNFLWISGTGLVGALIGGVVGVTVARHAQEAKRRLHAFRASFAPSK